MKLQAKALIALITLAASANAFAAERTVLKCHDGVSHGFRLDVAGDDEGFTRADLSLVDLVTTNLVAETVCTNLEIGHPSEVGTDGPWTVARCNNVDWVDRYDIDLIVSGFAPTKAIVSYNEQELVTLTCREVQ